MLKFISSYEISGMLSNGSTNCIHEVQYVYPFQNDYLETLKYNVDFLTESMLELQYIFVLSELQRDFVEYTSFHFCCMRS